MMNETSKVSLVSVTQGAPGLQMQGAERRILTGEDLIVYAARVSSPKNQKNLDTAPKLIKYLIKHKHWSPFELAHMTLEIITSRAIAQQILRHRSFSFQEYSQRYSQVANFVTYKARRQDKKNRQNSIDDMSEEDKDWFKITQEIVQRDCENLYSQALQRGIAKEQARFLLPLSTQTKMYMCGSVRSWIHYIQLRADKSTQKEHQEIAEATKLIFCDQFPNIAKALGWAE